MGAEPGKSQGYPTDDSSSLTESQNTSKIYNRLESANTSGPLLQPTINEATPLFPWNRGDRDVELRSPSVDNYLDVPNLQSSAGSRSSIVNDGGNAKYLEGIKATSNAKFNKNSRADELSHVGAGIEDTTDHTEFNEAGFDRDTTLLEDKLVACIRKALVKAIQQGDEKKFLPLDAQDKIITRNRVRQELSRRTEEVSAAKLETLTDEVWEIKTPSSSKSPGKTTTRRKIFAILGLIDKIEDILDFIQHGLYDSDLPFEYLDGELPVFRLSRKVKGDDKDHICLFDKWKAHELDSFNNYQWNFLAPYFDLSSEEDRKVRHYNLQNGIILPFMEDVEFADRAVGRTMGGYSEVWRGKLHPAHHNLCKDTATPEENPSFAVKELRHGDQEAFDAEVSNLKRFSERDHAHLIRLLVTFKWREKFYLLFPWADGNLLDFWQRFPQPLNPERDHNLALWFSEQCLGVAQGLKMIHTTDKTSISTSRPLNTSKYPAHGRHGDLKPENILWFKSYDGGEDCWRGVLKISDFGLARFHRTQSMSNFQTVGVSPTYRAPEYDIASKTSQSYDIWSLGCVLLEFVTWYLLGWEGVDQFSKRRSENDTSDIHEDKFFNFVKIWEHGDWQVRAQAKISVLNEFKTLYNDEKCYDFIVDLLAFIEEKLLRINPNKRVNCKEIVENLEKLHSDSRKDRDYCTKRLKKAPNRTGTDLSELTAATVLRPDRQNKLTQRIYPPESLGRVEDDSPPNEPPISISLTSDLYEEPGTNSLTAKGKQADQKGSKLRPIEPSSPLNYDETKITPSSGRRDENQNASQPPKEVHFSNDDQETCHTFAALPSKSTVLALQGQTGTLANSAESSNSAHVPEQPVSTIDRKTNEDGLVGNGGILSPSSPYVEPEDYHQDDTIVESTQVGDSEETTGREGYRGGVVAESPERLISSAGQLSAPNIQPQNEASEVRAASDTRMKSVKVFLCRLCCLASE